MSAALPVERSSEPLVGWRCWFVLPEEGLLRPATLKGLVWRPRQPCEAVCPDEPHPPPDVGCKCGLWAVPHPLLLSPAVDYDLPGVVVVGEVALWGRVIEHARGWRAQFSYPRFLYVLADDPLLAATLRERYQVPVVWGEATHALRRLLPPPAETYIAFRLKRALSATSRAPAVPRPPGVIDRLLEQSAPAWRVVFSEDRLRAALAIWLDYDDSERLANCVRYERDRVADLEARLQRSILTGRCLRWPLTPNRLATLRESLGKQRRQLAATVAAAKGTPVATRRVVWVRLVRAHRDRGWSLYRGIQVEEFYIASCQERLARGRAKGHRRRYAPAYVRVIQRDLAQYEQQHAARLTELAGLQDQMPTYREWAARAARAGALGE